jgi:hypothetical protein
MEELAMELELLALNYDLMVGGCVCEVDGRADLRY